ncbi:DHA2 family efflux MFS transporter permease subunit [Paenibacillus kobensis]|uniref:DHA2 family efflux MFS transporter permease subunit n=1 Tax=Paenibacillus kobensis TaxID=59841 RepID=UPI0013E28E33|nr:DHA2 family efflux MFS transporter permease subunit [Paenibacillus kobensis]
MTQPQPVSASRGLQLFLLCFGVFVVYLDSTIVNVAMPAIQTDLKLGLQGLQWIFDAYALVFASLLLAAGAAGDRFGHKRVFIAGMIGFTVASILCALANSSGTLIAARTLQGACGALLMPVSLAIIRLLYDTPAARAKAIGIWAGIGGLALASGPVLGGWLVERFDWSSIFWINVPIGLIVVAGLVAKLRLPVSAAHGRKPFDAAGQLLFIASIGALAYAIIEGNAAGWSSAEVLASFALSAVAGILFIIQELRHRNPLVPISLFRNPAFIVAYLTNFLTFFGLFGVIFLMTLYLQQVEGLSAVDTGVRFLALTLAIMLGSIFGSPIASRVPPRILVPLGSLMAAAGLFGLTSVEAGISYWSYAWALALVGLGISLTGSSSTVALMSAARPEQAGIASGIMNTFRQMSAVFGVALAGVFVTGRLRNDGPSLLAELGLPGDLREKAAGALANGPAQSDALLALPEQWRQTTASAGASLFVDGMHDLLLAAATASLLCGTIAFALLTRHARKARMNTAADQARAHSAS